MKWPCIITAESFRHWADRVASKMRRDAFRRVLPAALFAALICLSSQSFATPYWTPQDFDRQQGNVTKFPQATSRGEACLAPTTEIDEYALLFEYVQICDFLAIMQEQNPLDPNYGGMHEGESAELWAVVETDNTQEAIRVWSTYAVLSGDLETYRQNIAAAWVYTMNYPAYSEEGAESDYYRVHNCGWALVAESRYRTAYGDTTYLWYADSCAEYIQTHRLPYAGFPNFYARLHPLVEGWAAGTLYDYGISQSHPQAVAHALEVGSDVQDWIEADPNRLNNNEVWAMCGGTALWGVCRSVFAANPSSGQIWLPQYLPYMDTYASYGEWNNSWNVWYAHAYHASAAVLLDSLYTGYAFTLVDTLLDADTDNDGGIMATSTDPPTMDQSWVSAYLDYMGLEALINQAPALDAAAFGFVAPDSLLPVAQGEPQEVVVLVANTGTQPCGNVDVSISGAFTATTSTYLEFADVDTPRLGFWTPAEPGYSHLVMTVLPGGAVASNDTASVWVQVLGWGQIQGQVSDQASGQPLAADLFFYRNGFPPQVPLYAVSTDPSTGLYQVDAVEGTYSILVDPQIPYTDREHSDVLVAIGETTTVNFQLLPAPVLLVDDDGGAAYDTFYSYPLSQAGFDAYYWNIAENGAPQSALGEFQAAVWFTGNETDSALTPGERNALAQFLDSGGSLLLTGQNIAQSLAADPFLPQYLGCSFISPSSGQYQVFGLESDPVTSSLSLLLIGFGGAGNQSSTDVIAPVAPGVQAMVYSGPAQPTAAIRIEPPEAEYKLIFLAFGLEGASGLGSSTSRQEFLQAVMEWFQIPTGLRQEPGSSLPEKFETLSLSPNPFNPSVQIHFALEKPCRTEISVYNLLGQQVAELPLGILSDGRHIISYDFAPNLGSGLYIFLLQTPDARICARGLLLK